MQLGPGAVVVLGQDAVCKRQRAQPCPRKLIDVVLGLTARVLEAKGKGEMRRRAAEEEKRIKSFT